MALGFLVMSPYVGGVVGAPHVWLSLVFPLLQFQSYLPE